MISLDSYRIGVYEKALPPELRWTDRLIAAKEAGFDFVEMSIDESDSRISRLDWSDDTILDFISAQIEAGLRVESLCFSAQRKYPLGSAISESAAMDLLRKCIVFASKTGIRIIQAQGYDCYYDERSDRSTRARFFRNLLEGTMFAASHGVTLALETMETDFMNTTEKAMVAVERIKSPYLLVYPDIGNISNAVPNVADDIMKGGRHIVAAHLKETLPGVFREVAYGAGHVDFVSAIAQLYSQGVRRYVAEYWHLGEDNWPYVAACNREFLDLQFRDAGIGPRITDCADE
jgi:L-ribulose-5-phosphate 3-epimerase